MAVLQVFSSYYTRNLMLMHNPRVHHLPLIQQQFDKKKYFHSKNHNFWICEFEWMVVFFCSLCSVFLVFRVKQSECEKIFFFKNSQFLNRNCVVTRQSPWTVILYNPLLANISFWCKSQKLRRKNCTALSYRPYMYTTKNAVEAFEEWRFLDFKKIILWVLTQ